MAAKNKYSTTGQVVRPIKRSIPIERAGSRIISIGDGEERVRSTASYSTYTRMYKQHPIVRATIDKIAKTCVAAGYNFVPRDSKEDLNEAAEAKLTEIFTRSKMNRVLRTLYTDLMVYGDAFWWVELTRLQEGYAFTRVAPSQVSVVIDKETREPVSYIIRDSQGQETQFPVEDFVHFKIFDPDNDVYGLSPLQSLQSTVAQDLFAQTYNENFFANSAQTGMVFNMQNASKEVVERNREYIKKEYSSVTNAHKPRVLEGDVSVEAGAASHANMQFIEGRDQLTMEILAVFDMPYTKMGGTKESANRSQSSENDKSYRTETIAPLQAMVEDIVNEELILERLNIQDTIFKHRDVDTRDEEIQMKLNIDAMNAGVYDLNYVRGKLGLKPVAGGEEPFIQTPLGLIPISMIPEYAKVALDNKKAPPTIPGNAAPGGNLPNDQEDANEDSE